MKTAMLNPFDVVVVEIVRWTHSMFGITWFIQRMTGYEELISTALEEDWPEYVAYNQSQRPVFDRAASDVAEDFKKIPTYQFPPVSS